MKHRQMDWVWGPNTPQERFAAKQTPDDRAEHNARKSISTKLARANRTQVQIDTDKIKCAMTYANLSGSQRVSRKQYQCQYNDENRCHLNAMGNGRYLAIVDELKTRLSGGLGCQRIGCSAPSRDCHHIDGSGGVHKGLMGSVPIAMWMKTKKYPQEWMEVLAYLCVPCHAEAEMWCRSGKVWPPSGWAVRSILPPPCYSVRTRTYNTHGRRPDQSLSDDDFCLDVMDIVSKATMTSGSGWKAVMV